MYCANCGKPIPDQAKFCPRCGSKVEPDKDSLFHPVKTVGGGSVKRNAATAGTLNNTNWNTLKTLVSIDRIVAVLATILMIITMVVPFSSVQAFRVKATYTLFATLDFSQIIISGNWLKPVFIVLYIALILSFIIFKFTGKTRSLSSIGCVGSWILLIFLIMVILNINDATGYDDTLYLSTGLYVWAAGGILEIVSLALDPRKPADSDSDKE